MNRLKEMVVKNKLYASMIVGGTGIIAYNFYRQRIDYKMRHPLVRESVLLMQNNDDVVQMIGVPLVVEPSIGSRVSLADDRANFSYKVRGPRGTLNVELAGMSTTLDQVGVNSKGKAIIKDEVNKGKTFWTNIATGETYPIPNNVDEYNYNDFYVPDQKVYKEYLDLSSKVTAADDKVFLDPKGRFWRYEYLMAEVDSDLRILVAPNDKSNQAQQPIYVRKTLGDLKREF